MIEQPDRVRALRHQAAIAIRFGHQLNQDRVIDDTIDAIRFVSSCANHHRSFRGERTVRVVRDLLFFEELLQHEAD